MAVLTDAKARNIKPDSTAIPHGGVVGLTLSPTKTKGHGKWVIRYVSPVSGKRRNAGLGSYPEVSIAEAGKLGNEFRIQLHQGLDPLDEKAKIKTQAQFAQAIPTFQEAALILHADLLPSWKNVKHGQQWINTVTQYVFPHVGEMQLNQIEPSHVAKVLKPLWLDKPETASRVKQRIHAVMAWGWAHGYCQGNPVDVVNKLLPSQPSKAIRVQHQPAMPWREVPEFVKANVNVEQHYDVTRAILLFVILTACRSGEARGMKWAEVDFENQIWTIPATRMKMKLPHRVPLSSQAIALLAKLQVFQNELVFPSPRKGTELSDMALTSFLRKHNAPSDTTDRVATAHGFRSSFRDWCSENQYSRDLAERALAHAVSNQVEAAYHRTDLLEQRRPMMQAWADVICTKIA